MRFERLAFVVGCVLIGGQFDSRRIARHGSEVADTGYLPKVHEAARARARARVVAIRLTGKYGSRLTLIFVKYTAQIRGLFGD